MATQANSVLVSVYARTDVGRQRRGNEDAFLIADLTTGKVGLGAEMITHPVGERGSLLIVSDGMGGAAAGEVASDIAARTIRESLDQMATDLDTPARLRIATECANEQIWNEAQRDSKLSGMGATVTAALVQGTTAYIAQVGDSRAYLIRGPRIKQVTKDQSYAQAMVDSGNFTAEEIAKIPHNVILQALGTQPTVQVGLTAVELLRDDYLVVCSDGLSGKVSPEEMRSVVLRSPDLTSACRRLVDMANENGGEDNITVIVASFDGVGLDAANESTSITGSFKSLSKDYCPDQPVGDTMPLGSLPPPDENCSTIMMPSLGSLSKASAKPLGSETSGYSVSPQHTEAAPASTPKPKYLTTVVKQPKSEERATYGRLLLIALLIFILAEIGYLVYTLVAQ